MPFQLVPRECEEELFKKKGNFRLRAEFVFGSVEYNPDCWTEGIAVVVAEVNSEKIVAYWSSNRFGGYWVFIDDTSSEAPYLFKRRAAARRRMEKAGEDVTLRPHNLPRRQARLAVWNAGKDLNLPKYRQVEGPQFPGSPFR
jgi:hypothetical protein